jgi:hypothetical protein
MKVEAAVGRSFEDAVRQNDQRVNIQEEVDALCANGLRNLRTLDELRRPDGVSSAFGCLPEAAGCAPLRRR